MKFAPSLYKGLQIRYPNHSDWLCSLFDDIIYLLRVDYDLWAIMGSGSFRFSIKYIHKNRKIILIFLMGITA